MILTLTTDRDVTKADVSERFDDYTCGPTLAEIAAGFLGENAAGLAREE